MDLYVLRFRDYPCIPILFGWDCNPQSYGGVWILAQIWAPSHWSYICTLQIHQESIQLSSLLISWSWRRQQKILTYSSIAKKSNTTFWNKQDSQTINSPKVEHTILNYEICLFQKTDLPFLGKQIFRCQMLHCRVVWFLKHIRQIARMGKLDGICCKSLHGYLSAKQSWHQRCYNSQLVHRWLTAL